MNWKDRIDEEMIDNIRKYREDDNFSREKFNALTEAKESYVNNSKRNSQRNREQMTKETPNPSTAPKAFFSYSHDDQIKVDLIKEKIKNRSISIKGGEIKIDTFIDREDIAGGEDFAERIVNELEKTNLFLPFLSENSVESEWVREELRKAKNHEIENRDEFRIIPVKLDDCDVPNIIRGQRYLELESSYDHLADDIIESMEHHCEDIDWH